MIKLVTTFFYTGYLPFIPGTFGSIAGIALYYLIKDYPYLYIGVFLAVIALGFIFCGKAEQAFAKKDPQYVVIDEVAGMLLSLAFLPDDWRLVAMGFFIFRLLDTIKPFPANGLQNRHGALGIMADDLVAGIYTNLVLQAVCRIISINF